MKRLPLLAALVVLAPLAACTSPLPATRQPIRSFDALRPPSQVKVGERATIAAEIVFGDTCGEILELAVAVDDAARTLAVSGTLDTYPIPGIACGTTIVRRERTAGFTVARAGTYTLHASVNGAVATFAIEAMP